MSFFLVCCTWSLFNNAWIKHFVAFSKVSISSFWNACTQNGLEKTIMNIFNCDVMYFDCPWMFPPFKGHNDKLFKVEYNWNFIQSFKKMWIKRTFGHLKWRWRILLQKIDVNLQNIPNIVWTHLLLHNIYTTMGDKFNDDWFNETITKLLDSLQQQIFLGLTKREVYNCRKFITKIL